MQDNQAFFRQDNQVLLKELRKRTRNAVVKRVAKRAERYKNRLKEQLPSQIIIWSAREDRLLKIISGITGVPIASLLVRQCPDPPVEADPDIDGKSKQHHEEDKCISNETEVSNNMLDPNDPTIRPWTESDKGLCPPPAPPPPNN